jgi:spoIIIJ-associated protein
MEEKAKQPVTKAEIKQIEKIVAEFFENLGIDTGATVEEREDVVDVILDTQETGLIIGYHGETLESLQVLLSLAVSKRLGRFVRMMIDVGDYRKNRTEYLERLAEQVKDRALRENREQVVTSLKSWERRVIHMILQEDSEVITESQGEGRDRVLVVRPK